MLAAAAGTPTQLEVILAATPLLVGIVYFARTRSVRKEQDEQAERDWKDKRERIRELSEHPDRIGDTAIEDDSAPVNRKELVQMDRAAADLSCIGALLLTEAVIVIFIVLHHFGEITDHYSALLKGSNYNVTQLILLAVRTAAYGTIVATGLVVLVRFAGASFDQATRFRKRTHSAHVLNFVLADYEQQIKNEKVTLSKALEVFNAWNKNVESAFTSVRAIKHKQESVGGSVSPLSGGTFNYGPMSPNNGRRKQTEES